MQKQPWLVVPQKAKATVLRIAPGTEPVLLLLTSGSWEMVFPSSARFFIFPAARAEEATPACDAY